MAHFAIPSHFRRMSSDLEQRLAGVRANLVVMHPPTVTSWNSKSRGSAEEYGDWLSDVIGVCAGTLGASGYLVAVVRPGRQARGGVVDTVSPIVRGLEDAFGGLNALHVAVDTDGVEDWQILVGKNVQ